MRQWNILLRSARDSSFSFSAKYFQTEKFVSRIKMGNKSHYDSCLYGLRLWEQTIQKNYSLKSYINLKKNVILDRRIFHSMSNFNSTSLSPNFHLQAAIKFAFVHFKLKSNRLMTLTSWKTKRQSSRLSRLIKSPLQHEKLLQTVSCFIASNLHQNLFKSCCQLLLGAQTKSDMCTSMTRFIVLSNFAIFFKALNAICSTPFISSCLDWKINYHFWCWERFILITLCWHFHIYLALDLLQHNSLVYLYWKDL